MWIIMFEQSVRKLMERLSYLSRVAGFIILVVLTVDIISTKFFNRSITGAKAFTEMLMVLLVFLSLPYVTADRNHIVVDLIKFPPKFSHILSIVHYILGTLLSGFFVWRTFVFLQEAVSSKKIMLGTEGWLNFPLWMVAVFVVFGYALTTFVYIMQLIIAIRFPEKKEFAQEE